MRTTKINKIRILILIIGIVSILFAWSSAMYDGHGGLSHYNVETGQIEGMGMPTSSAIHTFSILFGTNELLLSLVAHLLIIGIILLIWKGKLKKGVRSLWEWLHET